jgi:peptidoglycan/LPS O-acetylase OafA/YrhL
MWFSKTSQSEDEEALLASSLASSPASSPALTTSCNFRITVALSARWRRVQRLIFSAFCQLLLFAVPSFLRRIPGPASNSGCEKQPHVDAPKKHSTEYLDGLRGLASFIVFIFHFTHLQYPGTNTGYGVSKNPSIWQLPIIRFVYSGAAMVSIFFVVSGYVLTHRFIQKMYRQEFGTLYSSLTSLTFRRALRLFLPALASCVLSFICASFGLIYFPEKVDHKPFHHGIPALAYYIDRESNPWTWDPYMEGFYNPQLWSIALEYRASMVVFLAVLGLARSRTPVRMAVESGIVVHAFGHKRWDIALFMAGMLIAEMDVFVHDSTARTAIMQRRCTKAVLITSVVVGIWLSGYPRDRGLHSFGYGFLGRVWPHGQYRRRFWLGVASIMIVGPIPYLPLVQALFNTRLMRYFGQISFALYLIHGLGNRTIGIWLLRFTLKMVGNDGDWAYALSYVVSAALYTPIIVWWSDMFWRAIDIPSTHFAKWIERSCASREVT